MLFGRGRRRRPDLLVVLVARLRFDALGARRLHRDVALFFWRFDARIQLRKDGRGESERRESSDQGELSAVHGRRAAATLVPLQPATNRGTQGAFRLRSGRWRASRPNREGVEETPRAGVILAPRMSTVTLKLEAYDKETQRIVAAAQGLAD